MQMISEPSFRGRVLGGGGGGGVRMKDGKKTDSIFKEFYIISTLLLKVSSIQTMPS